MSTVIPTSTIDSDESANQRVAPKKVLKKTYEKVQKAATDNKELILITGGTSKGKTALIHTICKDIYAKNRVISLTGKDIPDSNDEEKPSDLNSVLDFILASTDLNEKIIVTIDDAHLFPIQFLNTLLSHNEKDNREKQNLQILLTGPEQFKDQLLSIESVNADALVYCTIESESESEILSYTINKTYKISSDIKNLSFSSDALTKISSFIQTNKKTLDVILEWCSALTKKDQLSEISSETISRACEFAQQFAKDRNVAIENAYPPTHEVYKFINTSQSSKSLDHTNTEPKTLSANKETTKVPTSTDEEDSSQETLIDQIQNDDKVLTKDALQAKWVSKNTNTKNQFMFSPFALVIPVLLISFVTFIAYQINKEPSSNIERTETNVVTTSKTDNTNNEFVGNNEPAYEKNEKYLTEKIDIKVGGIKKPYIAPLILGEVKDSILAKKISPQITDNDDSEILNLLTLANQQLNNKQLTTPEGANALETYKKVLAKQPGNKSALEGINNVHDRYMSWAFHYEKQNDMDRAIRFYNKALSIDPNNVIARTNLNKIQRIERINNTTGPANVDAINTKEVQNLLRSADLKMLQIEKDVNLNDRDYKLFQETQVAYQAVLRYQPNNAQAKDSLSSLAKHYEVWADQQAENKNYNIAIFLYGQALNLQPNNAQLSKRIEQVRQLKNAL